MCFAPPLARPFPPCNFTPSASQWHVLIVAAFQRPTGCAVPSLNHSVYTKTPLSFDAQPHAVTMGRYRVCALVRQACAGGFTSGVSIRGGQGSATTDRVMRFTPHFASERSARRYAHRQAASWILNQQ